MDVARFLASLRDVASSPLALAAYGSIGVCLGCETLASDAATAAGQIDSRTYRDEGNRLAAACPCSPHDLVAGWLVAGDAVAAVGDQPPGYLGAPSLVLDQHHAQPFALGVHTNSTSRSVGMVGNARFRHGDLLQDRGVAPAGSQRGLRASRRSRRSGAQATGTAWDPFYAVEIGSGERGPGGGRREPSRAIGPRLSGVARASAQL